MSAVHTSNEKTIDKIDKYWTVKVTNLTEEEHAYLKNQAAEMNHSLSSYVKLKALDTTMGMETCRRKIFQTIPRFNNLIDRVDDVTVRRELREVEEEICRCLK